GVAVGDATQLGLGGGAVVVEAQAGGLADHVRERAEAAALAVGGGADGEDAGAAAGGDGADLAGEAGLAHAGLGGVDEDERLAAVDDGVEAAGDTAELGVAADERRGVAEAGARAGLVFEAEELEHLDRLTLAFEADRGEA